MKTYQIRRAAKLSPRGLNVPMHGSMVALALALHCPGLLAEEWQDPSGLNATSAAQSAIPWMSGGIGEEARDAMRASASRYNVHIVFSRADGSYLATIPFAVARRGGEVILAGVSDGPLLNLSLEPGNYDLMAEFDGKRQTRRLQLGRQQAPHKINFVATAP